MKHNTKLIVTVCLPVLIAAAGVFCTLRTAERMRIEKKIEERRLDRARFGIASDGRSDFVALPPSIPHAVGPSRLGEDLFCDRRLAQSQRRTCAACHCLNEGGTDGELHGGTLTRSVMNASFASVFLKDGSMTNITDVIAQMIDRRDRAGGGSLDKVVRKLGADEKMLARFKANYADGLTATNLLHALAEHNRTLISLRTPFDRYWGGNTNALDAAQLNGMEIFRSRNCLSCHDGPSLGGLGVSNGKKITALRGLRDRRVFLSDGSLSDLGAVLTLMPQGAMESPDRAALIAFLKSL